MSLAVQWEIIAWEMADAGPRAGTRAATPLQTVDPTDQRTVQLVTRVQNMLWDLGQQNAFPNIDNQLAMTTRNVEWVMGLLYRVRNNLDLIEHLRPWVEERLDYVDEQADTEADDDGEERDDDSEEDEEELEEVDEDEFDDYLVDEDEDAPGEPDDE